MGDEVLQKINSSLNRKNPRKQKKEYKISAKQRKIDHLSSRQKYELIQLHKELDQVMLVNSNVTRSGDPNKRTKKDSRHSGCILPSRSHTSILFAIGS